MNELEKLKALVAVIRNQRNFFLDNLAEMEATQLMEREAAKLVKDAGVAAKAETKPQVSTKTAGAKP